MDQPKTFGPWHVLSRLGQGGQGTVYKVRKGQDPRNGPVSQLVSAIGAVGDFACQGQETWANRRSRKDFPLNDTERLRQLIDEYATAAKSLELGAAKSLHHVDDDGLREKALARLAHEVEVLQQTSHPSIVKILDARPSDGWFVTELYEGGTLASCPRAFAGKIESALLAFRPLVEAAAALHAKNIVHRDIKPENVFLGADNRLVLGDMGIVYFLDNAHTRVSETYENVGSHIWMPTWAMDIRLDDVRPTFDVFSLGKVFWSMIAGSSYLPLWYHRREQYDVEKMFPNAPEMRFARWILDDSVVEDEPACLPSAKELLERVDECLLVLSRRGQPAGAKRFCRVCGLGQYVQKADEKNGVQQQNFGIRPTGMSGFRIFVCDSCGHYDLFRFEDQRTPPDWWSGKRPFRKP